MPQDVRPEARACARGRANPVILGSSQRRMTHWTANQAPGKASGRPHVMAGQRNKPNHQLAALIAETGFSNKGLARRVVDLGQMRGYHDLKYNHSSRTPGCAC
jgi:hypothetical protein